MSLRNAAFGYLVSKSMGAEEVACANCRKSFKNEPAFAIRLLPNIGFAFCPVAIGGAHRFAKIAKSERPELVGDDLSCCSRFARY